MDIHYKLFKTDLIMFKPRAKGRLIRLNITTLNLYLDTISVEGPKSKFFLLNPQMCFTSKNVKYIYLTKSDSISLISIPAHYLSVQNAVNASDCT